MRAPTPFRLVIAVALAVAPLVSSPASGQSPPGVEGSWQADLPLPNGVVQTFTFRDAGSFSLVQSIAVTGTYTLLGDRLVQSVSLPSGIVSDTSIVRISGDSLEVRTATGRRTFHRVGGAGDADPLAGEWEIVVGGGIGATYRFARDGTFRTEAVVGDEDGRYAISGDTLHLTSDGTFRGGASARITVRGDTLALTPLRGGAPRHFHRVPAPDGSPHVR